MVFPDDSTTETDTLNMPGGVGHRNMSQKTAYRTTGNVNAEKKGDWKDKDEGLDEQKKIETNGVDGKTKMKSLNLGAIDTDDGVKRLQEGATTS